MKAKKVIIIYIVIILLVIVVGAIWYIFQKPSVQNEPTQTVTPFPTSIGSSSFNWIDPYTGRKDYLLKSGELNIPNDLGRLLFDYIPIATDACGGVAGHTEITADDYYFDIEVDLNGDGFSEFFIFPEWVCGWGVFTGTGGGPIYIYQNINGVWQKIGDMFGGIFAVEQEKTVGFKNIVIYMHLSAGSGEIKYYQWNQSKSEYELVKTEEY